MINAIIVLYNKSYKDSITINSLSKTNHNFNLVIYDNGTKDFGNREWCNQNNFTYLGDGTNRGLSYAYNRAIEQINPSQNDFLVILDDDTYLSEDYINELVSISNSKSSFDVFLPIVKTEKFILSPSRIEHSGRVILLENVRNIDYSNITAINSGMVVKGNVYKNIKYDENLFLDCVDHDFMNQISIHKYKVKILNSVINQTYSRESESNIKNIKIRFEIYQKDFKVYCKKYNYMFYYFLAIYKLKFFYLLKFGLPFISK
ncbi:glycosyltransferase [Streptococcus parauberis]|uniref:glycosyltransferase n=1 Tax=Streptococcus parauberis TaxID=1348 RepID=UPI000C149711|nr:glycosyltransferase [Streptococcus parauberis]PIA86234.1 Glycosyl transferase family 2 [Streptococcus parauberis]